MNTNLDFITALEASGKQDEAYELLLKLPQNIKGLPAKLGWHKLRTGNFKEGYELLHIQRDLWRPEFVFSLSAEKKYQRNLPLNGKRIFIAPEGGLGDQILCARFVELYKQMGAYVLLGATPTLHGIFKSLPVQPDEIREPHTVNASEYDYWVGSFDAPILFSVEDPSSSLTIPYLFAQKEFIEKWREQITPVAQGKLKIGICWQGKQPEHTDLLRVESIPLQALLVLQELGQLFSFQREKATSSLFEYPFIHDLGTSFTSWDDTLACMSQMDVIVTCCTSVAHAAAALGKDTYVITTMNPYFTWIGKEETSMWYPNAHVFKQPYFGGWSEAVAKAKEHIADKINKNTLSNTRHDDSAKTLFNAAIEAGNNGEHDTALSLYREILSKITEESELYHMARYNLNWYEFKEENFDAGFLYRIESGRKLGFIITPKAKYLKPYLTAETNLQDKIILLSSECGAGDDILNARYARLLKKRGAKRIIWVGDKGLESVLRRIEGIDEALTRSESTTIEYDYWILTLELPLVLKPSLEEITVEPYIRALPTYSQKWQSKLLPKEGLKVGIRWKGEKNRDSSQKRSLPLPYLEKLLAVQGVVVYSLQRDDGIEDLLPTSSISNWGGDLGTWEDTVAAIGELDLIITSDTSIAHIACAMGKETWVVVRPFSYFAWIPFEDTKTHWYSSARIFREPIFSNWEVPFAKMEMALTTKLEQLKNKITTVADNTLIDAEFPQGVLKMYIHKELELVSEILRKQNWYSQGDLRLYDLILRDGDFFVDAGANIGWYSLYGALKVGKTGVVLAIEPDAKNFELLKKNAEINGFSQIHPLQIALGSTQSSGRLHKSEFNFGDHYVTKKDHGVSSNRESTEIVISSLDTLLENELRPIRFIKLDIQGAECKALYGMEHILSHTEKPFILLEFAPGLLLRDGSSPFELFAFIEKNQFIPFRVFDDYSSQPLLRQISVEELLDFTKMNRTTEIGADILLVHASTSRDMMEKIASATRT